MGLRRGLRPLGGKARLKGLGGTRPPHPGAHTLVWLPRLECWGGQPENRVRVVRVRGSARGCVTLDGRPSSWVALSLADHGSGHTGGQHVQGPSGQQPAGSRTAVLQCRHGTVPAT